VRILKDLDINIEGRHVLVVEDIIDSGLTLSYLVRNLEAREPASLEVSSYGAGTSSSGVVRILKDLAKPIEGRDVLVVEDILDTGHTLSYVIEHLRGQHPSSLGLCALLDKPARMVMPIQVDYRGFEIPDKFVVGYGLDFAERYRNLPFIGVLKPEVYAGLA